MPTCTETLRRVPTIRTLEENQDFCQLLRQHLDSHGGAAGRRQREGVGDGEGQGLPGLEAGSGSTSAKEGTSGAGWRLRHAVRARSHAPCLQTCQPLLVWAGYNVGTVRGHRARLPLTACTPGT